MEWAPREQNREADCLDDWLFAGFSSHLRVRSSLEDIQWLVMPGLLEAGAKFYEGAKRETKGQVKGPARAVASRKRKGERLRDREPW